MTLEIYDANAIRTTYQRSNFLPEPERTEVTGMLREYLDKRLAFTQADSIEPERVIRLSNEVRRIQSRWWDMAVTNARKDMNSGVAALSIESLNEVANVYALRSAVGEQERIVSGVWSVLVTLAVLGMIGMGSHAGIADSKRWMPMLILALSFAMVIAMIASLDRPGDYQGNAATLT